MQTIISVSVPAVITAAGTIVAALISRRGRDERNDQDRGDD